MRAELTVAELFSEEDELRLREAVLEAMIEDLLERARTFAKAVEQQVRHVTTKEESVPG